MNAEQLKAIVETDEYHKACLYETLAYICFSVGNQARESADEYLAKVGLRMHDIKYLSNNALKAFQRYHNCVKDTITSDKAIDLCEDYEKIRKALYTFAGLEENDEKQLNN